MPYIKDTWRLPGRLSTAAARATLSPSRPQHRPLSGVQSQPPGGRISAYALSGFDKHLVRTEKGPAWYGQMQGATLGSDEELTEAEFRLRSVTAAEAIRERIDTATRHEELIKWLQLAATLSIPLAAAVWKAILGKRRSKMAV